MLRADRDKLEKVIGDTPYGKFIVDRLRKNDEYYEEIYKSSGHVSYDDSDLFKEIIGIVSAYTRIHDGASQEALDTPNEVKIEICKKALKAVEDLENTEN